jgi:hypothetical protein
MNKKYASTEELLRGQVVSLALINDEQVEDNDDTNLDDDHNSRALTSMMTYFFWVTPQAT